MKDIKFQMRYHLIHNLIQDIRFDPHLAERVEVILVKKNYSVIYDFRDIVITSFSWGTVNN